MKKINSKVLMIILPIIVLLCTFKTGEVISYNIILDFSFESIQTYTPKFEALNIKEQMILSPMFTPDNALDLHRAWIDKANSTIDIQNQYITAFDAGNDGEDWDSDSSPIVRALIDAKTRGVIIRVQINEGSDSDNITYYFLEKGIEVKWMGNSDTDSGDGYLTDTHNKIVIIDNKVTLISSINFGENAFTRNREAGMIIQSTTVANYYTLIFQSDWADGEEPPSSTKIRALSTEGQDSDIRLLSQYPSHTNIEKTNFTGIYNVTLFTNPDNADEVIFRYLEAAKSSIYVSMYTISRPEFNNTLIKLKKANPSIDIQVLISNRRVGASENIDTAASAESLVENLIPVYNSTTSLNFYHNKYWIIDGTHVFVYSGNWSPRSVTQQLQPGDLSYGSSDANRDMGIAVHNAPDIASFFKSVWDADVAVADQWDLPIGVKQTSFSDADVITGTVALTGYIYGIENATVSYRWGNSGDFTELSIIADYFLYEFDTLTLENGITNFEVKAVNSTLTFSDKVKVNIVNYAPSENWRLLITEVLPNPATVDDAEGEYIELTNSFPFDLYIEKWQIGDDKVLYTFPSGYTIGSYSSIIIARDSSGFASGFGKTADIELGISLNNDGDYAQLLDHEGNYMDIVAYGDSAAPDDSEVISAPSSGNAIIRSPMHIDTDKASDFIFGSPDPKGSVPRIPLNTNPSYTGEDTPFSWIFMLFALISLPKIRRRLLR